MPIDYNAPKNIQAEDFIENPHDLGGLPSEDGYNAETNTFTVEVPTSKASETPEVQHSSSEVSMDYSSNYDFDYDFNAASSPVAESSVANLTSESNSTTTPKKPAAKTSTTTRKRNTSTSKTAATSKSKTAATKTEKKSSTTSKQATKKPAAKKSATPKAAAVETTPYQPAPLTVDTSTNVTPATRTPRTPRSTTSTKKSKTSTSKAAASSPVTLDERTAQRIESAQQKTQANTRKPKLSNDIAVAPFVEPSKAPEINSTLYNAENLQENLERINADSELSTKAAEQRANRISARNKNEFDAKHQRELQGVINTKAETARIRRRAIEIEADTQVDNERTKQHEARLNASIARTKRKLIKEEGRLELAPIKAREKVAKARAKTTLEQERAKRAENANERERVRQRRIATRAENAARTAEKKISERQTDMRAKTARESHALEREGKKVALEEAKLVTDDTYREEISIKAEKTRKIKDEREKQKTADTEKKILGQQIKTEKAKRHVQDTQLQADQKVEQEKLKTSAKKTEIKKKKTDVEVEGLKTKQHATEVKIAASNAERDRQLQEEALKQEEIAYKGNITEQKKANEDTKRKLSDTKLANSEAVKTSKQQTKRAKADYDMAKIDAQAYALETQGLAKQNQATAAKNDAARAVEAESYRQDVIDHKGILVDQKVKNETAQRELNSARIAKTDAISEAKAATEQHKTALAERQHEVSDAKLETEKLKNEQTQQAARNEADRQARLANLRASLQKTSMMLQQKAASIEAQKQQTAELTPGTYQNDVSDMNTTEIVYETPQFSYVPQEMDDRYVADYNDHDIVLNNDQRKKQEQEALTTTQDKKAKETDPKEKPKKQGFFSRLFGRNKKDNTAEAEKPQPTPATISINDPDVEYYQGFSTPEAEKENNIFVQLPEKSSATKPVVSPDNTKQSPVATENTKQFPARQGKNKMIRGDQGQIAASENEPANEIPQSTSLDRTAKDKLRKSFQDIKDRMDTEFHYEPYQDEIAASEEDENKYGLVPVEIEEIPVYENSDNQPRHTPAIEGGHEVFEEDTRTATPVETGLVPVGRDEINFDDENVDEAEEDFTATAPEIDSSGNAANNDRTAGRTPSSSGVVNNNVGTPPNGTATGNGDGSINGVLPNGTPFQINNNIYNNNYPPYPYPPQGQGQDQGATAQQPAPAPAPAQETPARNNVEPEHSEIKPEKPKAIDYKTEIGKDTPSAVVPTVTIGIMILLILLNALFFHSTLLYILSAVFGLVGVLVEVKPHLVLKSQLQDVKKKHRDALVEKYRQKEKTLSKAAQKVSELDNQIDMKKAAMGHLQFDRNRILNDATLTQAKKRKQLAKLDKQIEVLQNDIDVLEINRNGWLAEIKIVQEKADLKQAKSSSKALDKTEVADLKELEKIVENLKVQKLKLENTLAVASPTDAAKIQAELDKVNEEFDAARTALVDQRAKHDRGSEERKEKIGEIKDAIEGSKDEISARKQKDKSRVIKPEMQKKIEPIVDAINKGDGLEDFTLDDDFAKTEKPKIGTAQPFYSPVPYSKAKSTSGATKKPTEPETTRKSSSDGKPSSK